VPGRLLVQFEDAGTLPGVNAPTTLCFRAPSTRSALVDLASTAWARMAVNPTSTKPLCQGRDQLGHDYKLESQNTDVSVLATSERECRRS